MWKKELIHGSDSVASRQRVNASARPLQRAQHSRAPPHRRTGELIDSGDEEDEDSNDPPPERCLGMDEARAGTENTDFESELRAALLEGMVTELAKAQGEAPPTSPVQKAAAAAANT